MAEEGAEAAGVSVMYEVQEWWSGWRAISDRGASGAGVARRLRVAAEEAATSGAEEPALGRRRGGRHGATPRRALQGDAEEPPLQGDAEEGVYGVADELGFACAGPGGSGWRGQHGLGPAVHDGKRAGGVEVVGQPLAHAG